MHVKFKVVFEDGTSLESHDEMYNWLYDHTHALPPFEFKPWKEYWLISDEGHNIGVDFHTGKFYLKNKGEEMARETLVQMPDGEMMTGRTEKQTFPVSEPWKVNNGLEYFPVVGRRYFKGDWGEMMTYFCGWKIKLGKAKNSKTLQVLYHLDPIRGTITPETT